ncbi:hypothetical protein OBBRIDRAFT_793692 [Obba rivulosa]|uniref:Uncharacterized protein n=1 Tax=Obba rivulosa TaxID=1052685 RepID=A0A8E2DK48_9APHY|nr:hypothetical protein OBBRIDRAFT_793692 [Obba rivulosa]
MKLGIPRSIGHELRQLLDPANYSGRFPILYRTQWNEVIRRNYWKICIDTVGQGLSRIKNENRSS